MVENNKISIIVDLHDDGEAVLQNLEELIIPSGYECDVIVIRGAANKVAAYAEGCRNNAAKYKIYLDSNTVIRKKDLLCRYLDIFNNNSQIAVLDVSGNTVIPTDGVCITGRSRAGGFVVSNEGRFTAVNEQYVEVAAVDGFVFATQYDLPWQDNTFMSDRFVFTAQCVEYARAGYKLAVVWQDEECVALKNNSFTIDEKERNEFLDKYSAFIYPKVLIGITTYNRPEYLQIALKSAMEQTYRNIEIVISDDSTNDETAKVIKKYLAKDSRISYYKHENYTGLDNVLWLIRYFKDVDVEYINYLMDDDMLYPTKIEKMMTYYLEYEHISLVTSYRHTINENGDVCPNSEYNEQAFASDTLVAGNVAGCKMLMNGWNFVGEFSATLLRKSLLREDVLYGWIDSIDFTLGLIDMLTWLQLLTKGNLVYIAEPLSAIRVHGERIQDKEDVRRSMILHWGRMVQFAIDNNVFLTEEAAKRQAVATWFHNFSNYLSVKVTSINTDGEYEGIIYKAIGDFIHALDIAHVSRQKFTKEQLINGELPLKSIKDNIVATK